MRDERLRLESRDEAQVEVEGFSPRKLKLFFSSRPASGKFQCDVQRNS